MADEIQKNFIRYNQKELILKYQILRDDNTIVDTVRR